MTAEKNTLELPDGYELDRRDADLWILRRADGSAVAAFSAGGCRPERVEEAAREDGSDLRPNASSR